MKAKVIMDSGKEYVLDYPGIHYQDFINGLHNEQTLPAGAGKIKIVKNGFIFLDKEEKIIFNPSHVSSIEIIEKF